MIPATDMRRLRSLVLLLGSPVDGEVTAAARGMTRLLDRHGLTLHDLVASLAPEAAQVRDTDPGPHDSEGWHDIASWLSMHSDALSAKQQDFVRNMASRNPKGRPPSPAQMDWLRGLLHMVEMQTAEAA